MATSGVVVGWMNNMPCLFEGIVAALLSRIGVA